MAALQLSKGDPVLQFINKNYVSLKEDDQHENMEHLLRVLDTLMTLMKTDPLFDALFSRFYWAGSYYDGLRVNRPEEYDVDMVIKLPINYSTIQLVTQNVERPFVKLRAPSLIADIFHVSPRWKKIYEPLYKWTDADGFLLQNKLRSWIESVVSRTVGNYVSVEIDGYHYAFTNKKTGPATTFLITLPDGKKIDVDLVPVLEFNFTVEWPPAPFREWPLGQSYFAVPKPNTQQPADFQPTFWRLGFHDQERRLLKGKEVLKPTCKLLKKVRDNSPLFKNLASYYIKTIFLWEEERESKSLFPNPQWGLGITAVFLKMLYRMEEMLRAGRIDYFWDKQYNLIGGMSAAEKTILANRVASILEKIEKKFPDDPTILAKFLLTTEELDDFRKRYRQPNNFNYIPEAEGYIPDDIDNAENPLCCIL